MTLIEQSREGTSFSIDYGQTIEAEITRLHIAIASLPTLTANYPPRWLAIQLLEGDATLLEAVRKSPGGEEVLHILHTSRACLQQQYGADLDVVVADMRYSFINALVNTVLTRPAEPQATLSDRIDTIVTHRYLGIPIFLTILYLVFNLVQNVSAPYLDWIDGIFSGPITRWTVALLHLLAAPHWLVSLLVDGILAGVGGILVFVPGLLVVYLALGTLEESGYMARAAFVMDRLMSPLGLHGKSFLPMILGFGCNVPAIYGTRTIEDRAARIITAMMIPFMSCSARLPVYVIFGLAFFPRNSGHIIMALYLLGMITGIVVGVVLSHLLFGAERGAFVIELPPYRPPRLLPLWRYAWHHTAGFVQKAGTVILAASVLIWTLLNVPWGVQPRDSLYGQVSAAVAPAFAPAGFDQWQSTGALITGLAAKEMVVSTLSQVYVGETDRELIPSTTLEQDIRDTIASFGTATIEAAKQLIEVLTPGVNLFPTAGEIEDTALSAALRKAFTPLAALAFMTFVLLYVPCTATMAALFHECGWRWALLSISIQLIVPWIVAVAIYQGGQLLGMG